MILGTLIFTPEWLEDGGNQVHLIFGKDKDAIRAEANKICQLDDNDRGWSHHRWHKGEYVLEFPEITGNVIQIL